MAPPSTALDRLRAWSRSGGAAQGRRARFRQQGQIRLAPGKPWLDFGATQEMDATCLDFAWRARVRMGPGLTVHVCDAYAQGRGMLQVRLWGLIPLARAEDDATRLAQALRYLAEIPWCPAAWNGNASLTFQVLGPRQLEVAAADLGPDASVVFSIDDDGRPLEVRAKARPRQVGGRSVPTPWGGRFEGETTLGGDRVPARAEVWWDLPEGRFPYFRASVEGGA